MQTELTPEPTPAEALVVNLAKRGVTLHTDGVRVWPTPKASLTMAEAAAAEKLNAELVALLAPPPEPAAADEPKPKRGAK